MLDCKVPDVDSCCCMLEWEPLQAGEHPCRTIILQTISYHRHRSFKKTNSFTNDGVRGAVILRISQVSWRPLLRDELSQPVAPGGQDGQTEDEAGADCCEAHGSLWRSEGLVSGPIFILSPHLISPHNISASGNFTSVQASLQPSQGAPIEPLLQTEEDLAIDK